MRRSPLTSLALATALAGCHRPAAPAAPPAAAAPPPIDAAALDRAMDPCVDFYQFACGGWIAHTEIPPDRSSWQRSFSELHERSLAELRDLLEEAAAGRLPDPFADKLGAYWASCQDEAATEAHGLEELRAEWARIDAVQDRKGLADAVARLTGMGVLDPFPMYADQDAKDATQMVLNIVQGGLTLPDRDYYVSATGKAPEIRRALDGHLHRMLALAGRSAADADADARAIQGLEHAFAESELTRTDMRDPVRTYHRVDRPGLERLAPEIPWPRLFAELGHPELTAVNVTTPAFVERVGRLFASAPLDQWKAYLRWHLLDRMAAARALPRAFVDERFRFQAATFTGAKELQPRWKHCVEAADAGIGFALGHAYVRVHFGAEGKARTTRLVGEVEDAMGRELHDLPWMDAPTRQRALEKLHAIVNKVGYPERWRDYGPLAVARGSWFRNVLAAGRYEMNRQLAKVGKPVDRTEWLMTPPTVNAYYDPSLNEMVFPAGILQPPFFDRAAPAPVNYGAIGMVVGHELTHGFDDQGRKFDALGNLHDWWTPAVAGDFERRAACVAEQFSGYESLPGVKLNGRLTLGEDIADLGGLKLALAALRRAGGEAGPAVGGFTPAQQFFLGYAQAWCSRYRDEDLRRRAVVDPHAPAKQRVNGPLSNLAPFAAAFRCAPGEPMVRPPELRCEVW